jgi:hypothetical protein
MEVREGLHFEFFPQSRRAGLGQSSPVGYHLRPRRTDWVGTGPCGKPVVGPHARETNQSKPLCKGTSPNYLNGAVPSRDRPGAIFKIDYDCYVNLINTTNELRPAD